ncbi:transferase hexapeptide (six repeat-containing protein) [Catalinimonas alkaloidigena]|uniref:Transferase hexapeptide (Six repeat-containing protein) n=1 Tax=Catalinimonas alkaloidigena TaxID=1075417 RepID=A0A1G9R3K6_9BACT|nr:DapH/DapD/GlmU-related protein [Catalinimonas alkaloidigena]SDM17892.1 transferase hexapeptide (six repeat-containing protein) [Catalinimonas alkaloidigena]
MLSLSDFIADFAALFPAQARWLPWELTAQLPHLIPDWIATLGDDYHVQDGVAIHRTARLEQGVVLKAPILIHADCFVGAHAYLRGGVVLSEGVSVGPGCELKTSLLCPQSAVAHFNFIGDSVLGRRVNFEAGALTANHFNERTDKRIRIQYQRAVLDTGVTKFGALVGDDSRIGANAVLSPGSLLPPRSVVGRLALVDQSVPAS